VGFPGHGCRGVVRGLPPPRPRPPGMRRAGLPRNISPAGPVWFKAGFPWTSANQQDRAGGRRARIAGRSGPPSAGLVCRIGPPGNRHRQDRVGMDSAAPIGYRPAGRRRMAKAAAMGWATESDSQPGGSRGIARQRSSSSPASHRKAPPDAGKHGRRRTTAAAHSPG